MSQLRLEELQAARDRQEGENEDVAFGNRPENSSNPEKRHKERSEPTSRVRDVSSVAGPVSPRAGSVSFSHGDIIFTNIFI